MWETTEARLALLELLTGAGLKRRQAQTGAFEALAELPWTRATGRRDEIGLVEDRRHELVARRAAGTVDPGTVANVLGEVDRKRAG